MAEQPQPAPWTRREFLKGTAVAGGLAVGGARSCPAWAQGLKSISASHSVSTFVYGQHLVAAQKKLLEEEGVRTPDFVVPGGGAKVVQALAAGQVALGLES
jgi:ABC-type nitrate/sulfonate/bicarbonate transport system substrate-binding protein